MREDVQRLSLRLKELEKRVSELKREVKALARAVESKTARKEPSRESITDHLCKLKNGGWFSSPRTAADIRKYLEARSFFYERTDLTHPLSRAVKKELLYRHRGKRCWLYAAKPPENK